MRIAVLGSGVIGVASAWYLAKAGHDVVVVDRQAAPALETSFGNAGEISPGYSSPWAAPGIPMKALRWLFMQHAPLIIQPRLDTAMLRWMYQLLRNCNDASYALNKSRMVRLAEFSRDQLIAVRAETGITYDERSLGTLQLFREQKQLDAIAKDVAVLQSDGVAFEILDPAGCVAVEPGLGNSVTPLAGGLRLPNDETGDCFKFTTALAGLAAAQGVSFQFGHRIDKLIHDGGRIVHVATDKGLIEADAYLVALGSYSTGLLAPLGIRLPVYPVKGYSITLPIIDESKAPESTLLDESYKVAITRLGNRIRVGGMAELAGYSSTLSERRRKTLEHSVETLFPGAGDYERETFWTGLRPMTPDSTPVIGGTPLSNLFLNTGHGTLGWTMACGSGHVIADIMSGRRPAIEAADLSLARYG